MIITERKILIGLIAGLIVVAVVVAIYLLNIFGLCSAQNPQFCPFPFSEKSRFIRYATCALAKCSDGCNSKEVKSLCLEFGQGGSCDKWCAETCESGKECGADNAISMDVKGTVFLSSGDMQKYANWICGCLDYNIPCVSFSGRKNTCYMEGACQQQHFQTLGDAPLMTATGTKCGDTFKDPLFGWDFPIISSVSVPESFANDYCVVDQMWQGARIKKLTQCRFESTSPTNDKKITFSFWSNKYGLAGCAHVQVCPVESQISGSTT
jgi:hypothetical protein